MSAGIDGTKAKAKVSGGLLLSSYAALLLATLLSVSGVGRAIQGVNQWAHATAPSSDLLVQDLPFNLDYIEHERVNQLQQGKSLVAVGVLLVVGAGLSFVYWLKLRRVRLGNLQIEELLGIQTLSWCFAVIVSALYLMSWLRPW